MGVNDVLVHGAEPLYFLDYIGVARARSRARSSASSRGVAEGCRQAGCALVGGETAELPGPATRRASTTWPASPSASSSARAIIDGAAVAPGRRRARARLLRAALQRLQPGPADRLRRAEARRSTRRCPAPAASVADGAAGADADLRGASVLPVRERGARDGARHRRRPHRQPAARAAGGVPRALIRRRAWSRRRRCSRTLQRGRARRATPRCSARSTWGSATCWSCRRPTRRRRSIAALTAAGERVHAHRRDRRGRARRGAGDRVAPARGPSGRRACPSASWSPAAARISRRSSTPCARPDYPAAGRRWSSPTASARPPWSARGRPGVEALLVNPKDFGDRESFDAGLVRELTRAPGRARVPCRLHADPVARRLRARLRRAAR